MQLSKPPKPKATRKRLKKEILSDDFKKRKIFHLTSGKYKLIKTCNNIWTSIVALGGILVIVLAIGPRFAGSYFA
jgi:hypothetical protein